MAIPPCFHLADEIFPRVRAEAARRLVQQGQSQQQIAGALSVSQAMVSKYSRAKEHESDPLVLQLVDELLGEITENQPKVPSTWCQTLSIGAGESSADAALADILAAERKLMQVPPLALVPQIGMNIARSKPGAKDSGEVLAFPARLVSPGERLVAPLPAAWGGSRHLATCLLTMRKQNQDMHALANIRVSKAIIAALESTGHTPVSIDRNGRTDDEPVMAAFEARGQALYDPGEVGIEPCLYLAEKNAVALADWIQSLNREVTA